MAKVQGGVFLENIRGRVGDIVVKKMGNKVVVAKRPRWTKKSRTSKRVMRNNALFKEAVQYAQGILKKKKQSEEDEKEARKKGTAVFNVLISKYLKEHAIKKT